MKLTLSPVAGLPGAVDTTASVSGDVVTVNGVPYDLSAVPEGGEGAPSGEHPFIGTISREDGQVVATLRWLYDLDAAAAQQGDATTTVVVSGGQVPSPIKARTDA